MIAPNNDRRMPVRDGSISAIDFLTLFLGIPFPVWTDIPTSTEFIGGSFNEPKFEGRGEDADPICMTPAPGYSAVAVFDGMGGAGAKRYTDSESEIHTGAYLAPRYVREVVEGELEKAWLETDPFQYLDENLHDSITAHLERKKNTLVMSRESSVKSRANRELPTTMALAVSGQVYDIPFVECFWAGDSRVYLLTPDRIDFLTIDDTAPYDGDPYSPENGDLPMVNTICLDKEFHINRRRVIIPDGPSALIAVTDGCFGYFRNPIEFEHMLRTTLYASSNVEAWLESMRSLLVERGRQDDCSMSVSLLGGCDFNDFKEKCGAKTEDIPLAEEYYRWSANADALEILAEDMAHDRPYPDEESSRLANECRQAVNRIVRNDNNLWYKRFRQSRCGNIIEVFKV